MAAQHFLVRASIPLARARRGSALLPSLLTVIALAGLAAAVFTAGLTHSNEVTATGRQMRALYAAEAGLADALLQVADSTRREVDVPDQIGSADVPIELDGGSYWSTIVDNGDDSYTVQSSGSAGRARRTIEGILQRVGGSVFDHAIFAGNTSGDPDYALRLSGVGSEADQVQGDIYSAGDVEIEGDAAVLGDVLATGSVVGAAGSEGVSRPLPDIAGMDYESSSDVQVRAEFEANQSWNSNALGGSAFQLPEDNPAHVFRKNPDDRLEEINGTAKDDYFLEDPYMPVTDFTAAFNGRQGHSISLSGAPGKPGSSGNELVYFIDGNLWVHNKPFGRLRFLSQEGGTHVTFVVKGNLYFCDDVLLQDEQEDGVAFIAIKDPAHTDSGNIYLGDPRYGTIDRMYTYLYAENDFHDLNLDSAGSKAVEIHGTMTAGNHVAIERDFTHSDGTVAHSRLTVDFDPRLSLRDIELPGIPRISAGVAGFRVACWREVANP